MGQRPISALTAILASLLIIVPLYQRLLGQIYLERLNYVDGTTLIMVGVLLWRGILHRQAATDLQAVSIALVGALSFVFSYEAIYKLSFYGAPGRMPPAELREFVIQVGIALTGLVGFAFGRFRWSKLGVILVILFGMSWLAWLLLGFPQLWDSQVFYRPVIKIAMSWDMIYALNRATKGLWCLVFLSFYGFGRPPNRAA
jgi:hypothetical protein